MRKGCIAPICLGRNTTLALFLPSPLVDYKSCGIHESMLVTLAWIDFFSQRFFLLIENTYLCTILF